MSFVLGHLGDALGLALSMFWQVLWPLALGFLLSAVIEVAVPKQTVARLLGADSPRGVLTATAFGAASSSCSYAAVALARTLFRKGASFSNAVIFEFASTNLVIELGLVLLILLGWQFLAGELAGGVLMVVLLALIFRATLTRQLVATARAQAERGILGRMEGHAAMDMSVSGGPLLQRLTSPRAVTAIAHYFFMNIYSVWTDLVLGFLFAGALGAWVPNSWWSALFLTGHGAATEVWGAVIGPLVAMISFVCSVGNVPLAAVLFRGGISFAGVISFIFADLIIIPILNIYRKYYGARVSVYLFAVSYITMVLAGLAVGWLFTIFGAAPARGATKVLQAGVSWNSDTFLDIALLAVTALLAVRFLRTGGIEMLRMMSHAPSSGSPEHDHP